MIFYGGDYNPEQWDEEVWDEDVKLMQQAGVSMVSIGIFSWAKLEPREGEFDFDWLDRILDKLHDGGIRLDLATATASPPPWVTKAYPEVLPVTENGTVLQAGSRQQYCPSSPILRSLTERLVSKIAERYGDHPGLQMWHVNNEYGCHVSHCYCAVSADAFRTWLRSRYGSISALNTAWGTSFWSQGYSDFDEVFPPSAAPTFRNPTQLLDFDRFSSDALLDCFRAEAVILRSVTPHVPITTNFMGAFKATDYWRWAREVDIVSDDSYPDPADPNSPAFAAMSRDLMRSLGKGKPWLLMEQAPSAVNWRERNAPKTPGQMRAWSMQAVARGADGILFFQWRQSVAGAEKFHSGMLPHAGTDSRVWREVEALGAELKTLDPLAGTNVEARAAIVFDWQSWWSLEQDATPAQLSYVEGVFAWYRALWQLGVTVDFVEAGSGLTGYGAVIAPNLFVTSTVTLESLDDFARRGGQLLVGYQSGITDENAHITRGGYLGALQRTLGIRIEEFAPFPSADPTDVHAPLRIGAITGALTGETDVHLWSEFLHPSTAEVKATFVGGAAAGWPAITRNTAGHGAAWYAATLPGESAMSSLLTAVLTDAGIEMRPQVNSTETVVRGAHRFSINHRTQNVAVELVT